MSVCSICNGTGQYDEADHAEHMRAKREALRAAPVDPKSRKFLCRECRKWIQRPLGMWNSRYRRHERARVCEPCLLALGDPLSPKCNGPRRISYETVMYPGRRMWR